MLCVDMLEREQKVNQIRLLLITFVCFFPPCLLQSTRPQLLN